MALTVFPVDWVARDRGANTNTEHFVATCFGRDERGAAVALHVRMPVGFLVHIDGYDEADYALFFAECAHKFRAIMEMCKCVRRKSAWGFSNGAELVFAQLVFQSKKRASIAKSMLQKRDGVRTYEASADPLLRLFHSRDIAPTDWVSADARLVSESARITRYVDYEYECSFDAISRCQNAPTDPPRLVIASWDLETYSSTGAFPSGDIPDDYVIQAAVTFRRYDEPEPYRQVVFCLGETNAQEVETVCFQDESDLLNAFFDEIGGEKTDVMIGYNIQQFDWRYISGRATVLVDDATGEPSVDLRRLGRIDPDLDPSARSGEGDEFELNSGAYGDNKYSSIIIPGVLEIDLLQWFKRETKHSSYSLNAMSAHYLGDSKIDLPAGDIFRKWAGGDPQERGEIATYAAKDTHLPIRLLEKLCILENTREMSNATSTPMSYIFRRGQQIKVYSQLLKKGKSMGYVFPDNVGIGIAPGTKFTGAIVLEAKAGAYFDIVAGLDFASLYPSIIRAWNMCTSTLVMDSRYANLEGVDYYEIATDQGTFKFAQNTPGILPSLLEDLAAFRKKAKKDMAEAKARKDVFGANLFNAK